MARQRVMNLSYLACVLVAFADLLGFHFTQPVLVPYGIHLGGSIDMIALSITVFFAFTVVSMFWMPACADKFGRRKLLLISVAGSAIAYLVQGLAEIVGNALPGSGAPLVVFIFGRGLAGFFAGTEPVLQAAVTSMSMPNRELARTRLALLSAAKMTFGVAISPIAGALAYFGLNVPWVVAAILTALILVIIAITYTDMRSNVQEIHNQVDGPAEKKSRSPFRDPLLLSIALGNLMIFTFISGSILALPCLLAQDTFGLVVHDDPLLTKKNIANATGVLGIPNGITSLLCSTAIFLLVVKKLGEPACTFIACMLLAAILALHGFMKSIWQLAFLSAASGAGVGLAVPAIMPIIAEYASVFYKDKESAANGVHIIGVTLGLTFGANIVGKILGDGDLQGVRATYLACGCALGAGGILISATLLCMKRSIGRTQKDDPFKLTAEQMQEAIESGAVEPGPFIDELTNTLKAMLTAGTEECRNIPVWHGVAQRFVRRQLDLAFPTLRKYDESNSGADFFNDVAEWLFPIMTVEERIDFLNTHPQADIPAAYMDQFKTTRGALPRWTVIDGNISAMLQLTCSVNRRLVQPEDALTTSCSVSSIKTSTKDSSAPMKGAANIEEPSACPLQRAQTIVPI